MYDNRPHRTRKEIVLSHLLQGLIASQLSTQLLTKLFGNECAVANVCGVLVCVLYTLCKLLVEVNDDQDFYLNDDRIVGAMIGCLLGECLLIL